MSAIFRSINPKNNKLHRTFEAVSSIELESLIDRSYQRFRYEYLQDKSRIYRRFEKLGYLKEILAANKAEYAGLMTQEMGKPLAQAEAEVMKCATHIEYTIKHSRKQAEDEQLGVTNKYKSFMTHDPLGPFLGIIPWNFPFWMALK